MPHKTYPPNLGLADIIAEFFPKDLVGHAVDVGASDGISCNTTYGLEKERRWTVLSVEPNPEFWPALLGHRAWVEKCACSNFQGTATLHINVNTPEAYSTIGEHHSTNGQAGCDEWRDVDVRVETVANLLDKWCFPKLDVLCVDVEGTEQDVVLGADIDRWKPKIVVLESWKANGHDEFMAERGYRVEGVSVFNYIYQRVK